MKLALIFILSPFLVISQVKELMRFTNPNARQAVAVDGPFVYAINNSAIDKIDQRTLEVVSSWSDTTGSIPHLNSGIVIDDTLYCASSNYPKVPMTSSIERFTVNPFEHAGSHSFGIYIGSCTWILKTGEHWWVFFAHYENKAQSEGKGIEWSMLVKFDRNWKRISAWTLPIELLDKLRPYSLSGGVFLEDGKLLVSGHHEPYLYLLQVPASGSQLLFLEEIAVPSKGQGVAIDPVSNTLWGIDRDTREVINYQIEKR